MFFRIAYKTPPLYQGSSCTPGDRTLPSTDSRALNGLILWFEGYHYFR